jgi:hypothetical protein
LGLGLVHHLLLLLLLQLDLLLMVEESLLLHVLLRDRCRSLWQPYIRALAEGQVIVPIIPLRRVVVVRVTPQLATRVGHLRLRL